MMVVLFVSFYSVQAIFTTILIPNTDLQYLFTVVCVIYINIAVFVIV